MVTIAFFKKLALSLPEAKEHPHFENVSFKVKKKIFATLSEKNDRCCLKFSEIDQSSFCSFDKTVIYPVPNKWGKQGGTLISLSKISEEMLVDALTTSYCEVAPKKLSASYIEQRNNL